MFCLLSRSVACFSQLITKTRRDEWAVVFLPVACCFPRLPTVSLLSVDVAGASSMVSGAFDCTILAIAGGEFLAVIEGAM